MEAILDSIPDLLFLPVNLVRDIRKAQILVEEKREPGKPDILVESPLGFSEQLTRDEIVKKYTHANGSKIRLGSWKKGLPYMVMTLVQEQMYGIFIPSEYPMDISVDGRQVKINKANTGKGTYVICRQNEYGEIQRDDAWVVSPRYFRKMFCMSGSIKSNAGQCEELQRKIALKLKKNSNAVDKIASSITSSETILSSFSNISSLTFNSINNKFGAKKQSKPDEVTYEEERPEPEVDSSPDEEDSEDSEELTYKVTHRVVKGGKNVGFILEDTDGGSDAYTKSEIISLCKQGKITNLGIKEKEGKEYLHGIGVKLTELPETES